MGNGASVGVAAAIGAASAEDLRASLTSLPPELRLKLQAALSRREVTVRIPDHLAAGGSATLSPLDVASMGRAVPMIWFYRESLDADRLLSALRDTLVSYPVMCGRYDGKTPPRAIELNNRGVPVQISEETTPGLTLDGAVGRVPSSPSQTAPSSFEKDAHEAYIPAKEGMDPDAGSSEAPILKVKITLFPAGGTAIGMLAQHSVVDAEAAVAFFRNWSRVFRGLDLDPKPNHERTLVNQLSSGSFAKGEKPANFKARAVPPGEQVVPAFAPLMPKINGTRTVAVPLSRGRLQEMTEAAKAEIAEGDYISLDDVLTAHVWQALVRMRCEQVGLTIDSEETTTLCRAFNIRRRTDPPLGAEYFANGATQIFTELTVKALCATSPSAVARKLRASIGEHSSEETAALLQWYRARHEEGCKTPLVFDKFAMTFVVSSWTGFDWEGVDFDAKPVCFDHGALVPFVAVFTSRPQGDGVNVYTTGTHESTEHFSRLLTQSGS